MQLCFNTILPKLLLFLFTFLMLSCSSLTPLGIAKGALGFGDKGGIDVSANIGKEIEDEDNAVKIVGQTTDIKAEKVEGGINSVEGNSIKAEKIDGGLSFTTIQAMPMEMQLLMILGWILPSPSSIWNGLLNLLPWRRRKNEHT